jgi:hypothetical protein
MYLVSSGRNRRANCEYLLVWQRKEGKDNTPKLENRVPRRETTACPSSRYVPFFSPAGNVDGEEENLLVRQPFQWRSEKKRVQKIAVHVLEAERVSGDIGLSSFFPSHERTWFIEEPRAKIARVEKWVQYDSSPGCC